MSKIYHTTQGGRAEFCKKPAEITLTLADRHKANKNLKDRLWLLSRRMEEAKRPEHRAAIQGQIDHLASLRNQVIYSHKITREEIKHLL